MFWRASISSHRLFDDYKLAPHLEESSRNALLSAKSNSPGGLVEKLERLKLPMHPYADITSNTFKDDTANILAAINPENPASLHVDRFAFLLYERPEDVTDPVFSKFGNIRDADRMIIIMAERLWDELMVKKPLSMLAEEVQAKRKAQGQKFMDEAV